MTNAPAPSAADSAAKTSRCPLCARETDDERLARYAEGLKRLGEIGLALAEELHPAVRAKAAEAQVGQAEAGAAPQGRKQSDPALTFDRIARCVRLTFMLDDKLHADFAARRKADATEAAGQARNAAHERKLRDGATVDRVVREAIQAEAADQREYDHLNRSFKLRLDREDLRFELGRLPVDVLIARICRDLGLEPEWEQWQGEAWRNGGDQDDTRPVQSCPICGRAADSSAGLGPPVPEAADDSGGADKAAPLVGGGSDPP